MAKAIIKPAVDIKPAATTNYALLAACIVVCLAVGAAGTFFTAPNITGWYAHLSKPSFTPPNWLFGPVWTLLYVLMGIALYLVAIDNSHPHHKRAVVIFAGQLALNFAWSLVFFGLKNPLYGLCVIIALDLVIIATIIAFWRVNCKAACLLLPYLAWCLFASALNLFVWRLN